MLCWFNCSPKQIVSFVLHSTNRCFQENQHFLEMLYLEKTGQINTIQNLEFWQCSISNALFPPNPSIVLTTIDNYYKTSAWYYLIAARVSEQPAKWEPAGSRIISLYWQVHSWSPTSHSYHWKICSQFLWYIPTQHKCSQTWFRCHRAHCSHHANSYTTFQI